MIDEPAAAIVREIFDAVIAGKSTRIAANLNARGISTPQEYKGVHRKEATEPQWTHPLYRLYDSQYQDTGVTNHTRESRHTRDRNQWRVPVENGLSHRCSRSNHPP